MSSQRIKINYNKSINFDINKHKSNIRADGPCINPFRGYDFEPTSMNA